MVGLHLCDVPVLPRMGADSGACGYLLLLLLCVMLCAGAGLEGIKSDNMGTTPCG